MPVQLDVPNGVGSISMWDVWGYGASDKIVAVSTYDQDYSVIWGWSRGKEVIQLYTFPVLLGVGDPVTSASITCWAREYLPGNAERHFYLYWNGVKSGQDWGRYVNPTYAGYSYSAVGSELSLAAVNGQHGVYMNAVSGTGFEVWVSYIYRVVDYGFSGGASVDGNAHFAHLIGSIAGAVIGPGLLFREMPALARYIWKKARIFIKPSEYSDAFRAWTEA